MTDETTSPFEPSRREIDANPLKVCQSIPNIGSVSPGGWQRADIYKLWKMEDSPLRGVYGIGAASYFFVDHSGLGQRGEPALTASEFMDCLMDGVGYAIVEEGPFQVKIGVFKRDFLTDEEADDARWQEITTLLHLA